MDCSLPASSVHGIFQARILEWVAISFSRRSSRPRDQTHISCIAGRFFAVLATRESQEYWSGLPFPSPEDLPDPGIKPSSPVLQSDSLSLSHQRSLSLPPNQTSGMTSIRTFTLIYLNIKQIYQVLDSACMMKTTL